MKTLSFSAIFLIILFISAGRESKMVNAVGSCDVFGHGGGCEVIECFNGCRLKFGVDAHGFCFTVTSPNDTCMCRYPC
ncbi:hypothetical protein GQ457_01G033420 [Hibiscus cannabinus]